MNFREPLQQVNKNAGPHQIIRIKAPSRELRPQPKQFVQAAKLHWHMGKLEDVKLCSKSTGRDSSWHRTIVETAKARPFAKSASKFA